MLKPTPATITITDPDTGIEEEVEVKAEGPTKWTLAYKDEPEDLENDPQWGTGTDILSFYHSDDNKTYFDTNDGTNNLNVVFTGHIEAPNLYTKDDIDDMLEANVPPSEWEKTNGALYPADGNVNKIGFTNANDFTIVNDGTFIQMLSSTRTIYMASSKGWTSDTLPPSLVLSESLASLGCGDSFIDVLDVGIDIDTGFNSKISMNADFLTLHQKNSYITMTNREIGLEAQPNFIFLANGTFTYQNPDDWCNVEFTDQRIYFELNNMKFEINNSGTVKINGVDIIALLGDLCSACSMTDPFASSS
jgi:hypothetical protein